METFLNTITIGDARELASLIPDESIDLIFCDPPYLREHIEDGIYAWLAETAARVLKPGGFCLAYAGTMWKQIIMREMADHLTYHWDFVAFTTGYGAMIWSHHVIARHKSILAFVKGKGRPTMNTLSVWTGTSKDKRYHKWGQDEGTAAYYLQCFSRPGDLIWDPFVGGGTVPAMALQLGRRSIGFERDPQSAETANKRIETTQMLLAELQEQQQVASQEDSL